MKIFLTLLLVGYVSGVSVQEDLSLTKKQKLALDELKEVIKGKLPHEYMYEDLYLIRWLRAKNFKLKDAENMLMQNVQWRKENNMDAILTEDWTDFKKKYKYWIDGQDKEGRPILFFDVGEWDLRGAIVAGQTQKLGRYIDHIYEEVAEKTRKLRFEQGKNVTQYYILFDMEGFTLAQQGCAACIPLTTRVVTTYENYYPGTHHKTVIVNTPSAFQTLLQILKPLMAKQSRDSLYVYGNKEEGVAALLKDIDADQLATELGGTRPVPNYSS